MPKNAIGNIDENKGLRNASLRQKSKEGQKSVAYAAHDKSGQNHTGENGGQGVLHAHIHKGSNESTCPCAGSGQRDAHEEQKTQRGVLQHLIRFGVGFILHPFGNLPKALSSVHPGQNLADKQKNKGNGQYVSEETDQEVGNPGQSHSGTQRNGTTQFNEGNHGTEEDIKILFEKLQHSRIYAGDVDQDISRPFHEL